MQLDANLIEVAEAKARAVATKVAPLKASVTSSSSADTRSRGSRGPGNRVPTEAQPSQLRLPPPHGHVPTLEVLEADLSVVIDVCNAEAELGISSITADLLAKHQAEARLEASEAAHRATLLSEEQATSAVLHARTLASEQQAAMFFTPG